MFPTHRSVRLLAALATAAALVALPALAPAGQTNTVQLSAKLKGNQEVPGPGDRNGKGEGFVSVKATKGKLCFQISWKQIEQPSAGHIHKGAEASPAISRCSSSIRRRRPRPSRTASRA